MEEFPCPIPDCTHEPFRFLDDLYNHAFKEHGVNLRPKNKDDLTKDDFIQVDSSWVYAVDGAQLILSPNAKGEFRLQIIWTVEPIPPATQYPTEPEWDTALIVANKFKDFQGVAGRWST